MGVTEDVGEVTAAPCVTSYAALTPLRHISRLRYWSIHTALGCYVSAETQAQHFVIRAVPERRRRWTSGASAALARCVTATCTLVRALPLSATPFYALPSASGLTQVLMHMTVL